MARQCVLFNVRSLSESRVAKASPILTCPQASYRFPLVVLAQRMLLMSKFMRNLHMFCHNAEHPADPTRRYNLSEKEW